MASAPSSRQTRPGVSSVMFPRARVHWSTRRGRNQPLDAWLCISAALRWVRVDTHNSATQVDLSSFRGQYCLSLERLKESAVWEDVEEVAMPFDNGRDHGFTVCGELTHPGVWRAKKPSVKLDIIFDTVEERNATMEQVRIRVSPWQLLCRRMKEAMPGAKLSDEVVKDLFGFAENTSGTAEDRTSKKSFSFKDALEEGAKGVNVLIAFLQAAATIVNKSVENSPTALSQGIKVVEEVNEYVKCVPIVSSVVQMLVIGTKLVEQYTEMKRGEEAWPRIYARVEELRKVVVQRIILIMHQDGNLDEILLSNMIEVQEELVNIVASIEEKLMRGSGPIGTTMKFWNAKDLEKIEGDLQRLKGQMINVVQSSSIAQNSKELKNVKKDVEELKQNKQPHADQFKPYFDTPPLPQNLVFDFRSLDNEGAHNTPEGILLKSVLQFGVSGNSQGASALGTHGMGGVGKTTTLKKICGEESVRTHFVDGVCFMQFGQDATLQKVREEIIRCVRNFGGVEVAKDMINALNLGEAAKRAAEWLKGKAVLLVCDDLWATGDNDLGYVPELKQMLREAPKSGLLISTRDRIIAHAVSSSPVSFECVEPQGWKAREILGRAAFGPSWQQITCGWDAEQKYVEILKVCAGLPLALGIVGSGVKLLNLDSKDASLTVANYWKRLVNNGLNQLQCANSEYHERGLKYVVEASLQLCDVWGFSEGRNVDLRRLFRSLCVLEKQQLIPESTLERYWGLDKQQVSEIVEKFTNLSIVKRNLLKRSANNNNEASQFFVHMHDLILELCQEMVGDEEKYWHSSLINSYRLTLKDDKEIETRRKDWWNVEDDGCVYGNLSRHLIASGCWTELEALLCDVRWTLRRFEMGGWTALDLDFKRLLSDEGGAVRDGIRKLHSLLRRCWDWLRGDQSLFAFYLFGHLSKQERQERYVSDYLKTVTEHFPSPWLYPLTKCVGPEDNRESSRWNIGYWVKDLAVSWSRDRVVIASLEGIHVWSLIRQEEHSRISLSAESRALCVALSEDAKVIVSGHWDGTVRRWNGDNGESIGNPMSGHRKRVCSVAIRGNLIVSGSCDGLLYRWNATTGESIGSAMRGHRDRVTCIVVSADGQSIVSGSWDGAIRRWDAGTGAFVGFSLKGLYTNVTSLVVSTDGELLVLGHGDGTVRRLKISASESIGHSGRGTGVSLRRWRARTCESLARWGRRTCYIFWLWEARTREAVGNPLQGHKSFVRDVAVSEDGNRIVSCSENGDVCLWDTLSGEAIGIPLRGHSESVTCAAISTDGKLVLSGSEDGTVRQWNVSAERNIAEQHLLLTSPDEIRSDPVHKGISSLSVCANGKLVVSGSEDGTIHRWDMLTGEAVGRPMLEDASEPGVHPVAISRDGTLIVSGDSHGMVRRWDGSTGEAIGEPIAGHSGRVSAVVISDDGKLIVSGSFDKTIRRWDARTGEEIGRPMKRHLHKIRSLAMSTDGNLIVSISQKNIANYIWLRLNKRDGSIGNLLACGWYGSMRRWNARTEEQIGGDIKVPYWAEKVVISNDGETIACGSMRHNYVQKWEAKTGKLICEPMKWSEGEHMLSEMERRRLCVDQECDAVGRKDTFPLEMECRAACPDKEKIVLGLDNGSVAVCQRR